jgi:putative cardiolipin synthase
MHNKSFTVDNTASIIGGRNVGDEYFGTGPESLFIPDSPDGLRI